MEKRVLVGFLVVCCCVAGLSAQKDAFAEVNEKANMEYNNQFLQVYDDEEENLIDMTFEEYEEAEEITQDKLAKRVIFNLFTKDNPKRSQQLQVGDTDGLKKSNFDPKKPTRFITHGWVNSGKSRACTLIRDAYLKHDDYNIIIIDWSSITFRPYSFASNNARKVGHFVATMLDFLARQGMDPSTTHMVGHSLGAHVVGIASRNSKNRVSLVVACDPAAPNFYLARPGYRVAKGDADHVEVIHTNAGLLGFMSAIGDSDFYPNGGSKQVGCGIMVDMGGACSHARSYKYYAESVNSEKGFVSTQCASYADFTKNKCPRRAHTMAMGGVKISFPHSGVYYLSTNTKSPYAMG